MKYTIEERQERARAMRREGWNCAQCIVRAFDDLLTPEKVEAVTLAAQGFGSGYGGKGLACGALSGANMVIGLLGEKPRPAIYSSVADVVDSFADLEGGVNCAELKHPGRKPCMDLITDAVAILHRRLEKENE